MPIFVSFCVVCLKLPIPSLQNKTAFLNQPLILLTGGTILFTFVFLFPAFLSRKLEQDKLGLNVFLLLWLCVWCASSGPLGLSKSLDFSSIWNILRIKFRLESGMKLSAICVASLKLKTTDIQWRFFLKLGSRSIWKLLTGEVQN